MNLTKAAINFMKSKIPVISKSLRQSYEQGYHCGKHGANLVNCHFSLFQSEAHRDAWQEGNAAGVKGLLIDKEKFTHERTT